MEFKGSQTEKNLLIAFAGESQARNMYQSYAAIAKKEGYIKISNFFLEVADHELSHAKNFSKFFEGGTAEYNVTVTYKSVGTTQENLKQAILGEQAESENLYPHFAEIAKKEGFTKISAKFKAIAKAEAFHLNEFLNFLSQLENNTYFNKEEEHDWYCIKCGYIHTSKNAPEECPACNHPKSYFTPLQA